jgi:hypothetical protein
VRIVLDVDTDNVTSALQLYERAGMASQLAFTVCEKSAPQLIRPKGKAPTRFELVYEALQASA